MRRVEEQYGKDPARDRLASTGHALQGAVAYRAGRFEQAARHLEWALHKAPPNETVEPLFFLAMAYRQLGRAAEAQQTLARAVQEQEKLQGKQTSGWPRFELQALRREADGRIR
jgi:Flp pilus assembly protein TadD